MFMISGTLHKAGKIAALAAIAGLAAACQPSAENRLLKESGMTMEDPALFPSDGYLRQAKVHFHNADYGLAEVNFRKAVEVSPRDTEAWLGLAASYDQLRRFDLADKAYQRALALGVNRPIILNNMGYSQLMRGDTAAARRLILQAYDLDPDNPYILNNLALLGESGKTIKRTSL
jgi:Flp pilus assembly protein TadD